MAPGYPGCLAHRLKAGRRVWGIRKTLTSELNLSWQTLQEMTCFFLGTKVTPNVWFMTAFCTGSIWSGTHRGQRLPSLLSETERCWQSDRALYRSQSVLLVATTCKRHTPRRTVLKFGKSPTGDVVSTGNGRNGFIITEVPVAPMRPGKAPPTALHPLPGNKEKGEWLVDFWYHTWFLFCFVFSTTWPKHNTTSFHPQLLPWWNVH